jgi:hypothetical protein
MIVEWYHGGFVVLMVTSSANAAAAAVRVGKVSVRADDCCRRFPRRSYGPILVSAAD